MLSVDDARSSKRHGKLHTRHTDKSWNTERSEFTIARWDVNYDIDIYSRARFKTKDFSAPPQSNMTTQMHVDLIVEYLAEQPFSVAFHCVRIISCLTSCHRLAAGLLV